LHVIAVGHLPVSVAIGARSGRVFVANHDDHTVSVIDGRSWRVLRTLAVGPYPIAVIVDDAAGRAIVANTSMYAWTQGAAWPWLPPPLRRMLAGSSFLSTRTIPSVPTSGSVSLLDLGQL
jgi:YVTN family beta-propeller protein